MYTDSEVDSATVSCFFDFHEKILLYYVDHSDQMPNLHRCKLDPELIHFSANTFHNGMYLLNV